MFQIAGVFWISAEPGVPADPEPVTERTTSAALARGRAVQLLAAAGLVPRRRLLSFLRGLEAGADSQGDPEGHEETVSLPKTRSGKPASEGVQGFVGKDDVSGPLFAYLSHLGEVL